MRVHVSAIDFIDLTPTRPDVFRFETRRWKLHRRFSSCQLTMAYREQEPHIAAAMARYSTAELGDGAHADNSTACAARQVAMRREKRPAPAANCPVCPPV